MRIGKILLVSLLVLLTIGSFVFFYLAPVEADRRMNHVLPHAPYSIPARAEALHRRVPAADLHADMLLWMRDPARYNTRGHTDLPRLRKGGMALQVFSVVTKSPANLNYGTNDADTDQITLLAMAQRWPVDSWGSLLKRAVFQAARLERLERSQENFMILRRRGDVETLLAARAVDPTVLGGILATEGAHPLEGKLENIDVLYDAGYRVIGLQHFFDNELGGSLHGLKKGGLTEFGREAVVDMVRREMIIDVAHSSPAVVRDVLALTDRPVIVSHTGIYSLCQTPRNIPDELMAQIAARGGLIGIGFWPDVTCDASPDGIAKVIQYAAEKFGVDHIALGSDFDGTVTTALDAAELPAVTAALLRRGMSEADIEKVMGGNAVRFFAENLPQ